jgi:2,4-dienoyl-CoA reductase-like NADH-dependent reductase (Old Yellow Enzyme family)
VSIDLSPAQLLGRPLTLPNGALLPNRLAKSAMSEALATRDQGVSPELVQLYARWAAGGIGLNITGNVMIDRRALGEPGNVVIEDDRDLPMLRQWAAAAKGAGGAAWVQLNHPGKQAPKGLNRETVAPSAVGFGGELQRFFHTPRELTEPEILDLIGRFGRAAAVLDAAGFDGVQIHGAHGYLVSQFLSPRHNLRTDAWGGDAERRRRFVLEVYRAMRAATRPEFSIGIKLNSADFQRGGFDEGESLAVMQALDTAGIDLLEISGGTYEAPVMSLGTQGRSASGKVDPAAAGQGEVKASTREREAYFLAFAEKSRRELRAPLMVTGGFRTLAGMGDALLSDALDVIGLGRPLALEPDLPRRLLQGLEAAQVTPKRIATGIPALDRVALMEVVFYARQMRRMGHGKDPQPKESPLKAALASMASSGWKGLLGTRLRA